MPSRIMPFVDGEYYHILNRGIAQMPIFTRYRDHQRFIKTMLYYQIEDPKPRFSFFSPSTKLINSTKKIIYFVCYCLMPNHFHFLLQQVREGGITEFISKLSNSYTKYFNTKYKRNGPIFQGEFKAVHIETNEQLVHLSRYIHLNPLVGYIVKSLESYDFSSFKEYLGATNKNLCHKEIVLSQFKSVDEYKKFVYDQEDYGKQLEVIKHQLIDYPQV
ncbi:MAG: transposase [Patescibacteria group bacterium]